MQYYLILPGDSEGDSLNEANLLGDQSFGVLWAGYGLKVLMTMVDKQPELLPHVKIKGEDGKNYTIEQFLDTVRNLQIRSR